jgi:hypothetical protein
VYSVLVYGLANTWIDVKYTYNSGPITEALNAFFLNGNGYAVQPVSGSTPTGTYKFTHVRQSGTSQWTDTIDNDLQIISDPPPFLETDIQPRVVPRPSAYAVQVYGAPNSLIDVKYSYNGGPVQTAFGVWATDSYGAALQIVDQNTAVGRYVFIEIKRSIDVNWRNIDDIIMDIVQR